MVEISAENNLNINKTNNNMDKLDININSDETTYINDSEHSKSENNITNESENDLNNNLYNKSSENNLNNNLQNNKIYSNILSMSKARRTYLTRLNTLASKIKDEGIKNKIEDILRLYENKQISQFATAKNLIKSFTSKDEKKIKKAEENFKKHREAKPINERMKQKYVRIEHKNIDKPQSSIKFRISQKIPDFNEALITLKDKFITQMHTLFNTRPNYRICLGVNADFAFAKTEAKARVGKTDPSNQINPEYITVNKTSEIEVSYKDGWDAEVQKVKTTITNITFKTKAQFIYNKKK
jgi:hypothetical protein